ncbi:MULTISPECIES: hypothetical protein [Staphylococcus]|uniref:Uncharacterized protein n=1 Tax=Staphylococcus pettenkoferi TaxID=170573 RepID=A0A2N6QHE1_9STAP|nr:MULTISPECIES: hypothetical protein [Staphylococcus]MBX8993057.1 hypothetical protein [Staphylococcus pettenkoferi]MCI2791499.1 hypothetical protein [Staphylococcus pettenkoferi]MCY1567198.1 hypothetical protein [Staphylococcus pettenkoferi]MCY1588458.1 hypothetical protein [Staphylococcus pettenkoferi]OFK76686.1 hypothetical protein HMPREF2802_10710 [Staphylococcus sp. HMSC071G07]
MKKIWVLIEKYLLFIFFVLYSLIYWFLGHNNILNSVFKLIIDKRNDVLVNVASIFIGMYISILLIYPSYMIGGGLDKLSKKNYLISIRYIIIGLLISFVYILYSVLDGLFFESVFIHSLILLMMFLSCIRVSLFVVVWLLYDILNKKMKENKDVDYNKRVYERLKNIEEVLKKKK